MAIMKKMRDLFWAGDVDDGREAGGDGPLEGGDEALGPVGVVGDLFGEGEGLVEGVEGDATLRPGDSGSESEPDPGDDAVGAPGVEDVVDGLAFVEDDAGFGFHGDDFDGADGFEVAQAAVGDGADAAGASAEEAADGRFDDGAGVAAKLQALFACGSFERAEADVWLADGDAFGSDGFDAIHADEVEDDAAVEGDGLAVVPGAGAARGDGDVAVVTTGEDALYLFDVDGLQREFGGLVVELLFEDGGVPVEVAGETLHDLRVGDGAGGVGDAGGEGGDVGGGHEMRLLLLRLGVALVPLARVLQVAKAFNIFGWVKRA